MATVSASERDYGGGRVREKAHEFDPEPRVDMHGTRVQGRTVTPDRATISLLITAQYCMS